jgi:integrase
MSAEAVHLMTTEGCPSIVKFRSKPTKKNLTKRTILALEPPGQVNGKMVQSWVYDSKTPRLAICCWSSGSKVWYWVARFRRQIIRMNLGKFPEVTPEQARKLAAAASAKAVAGIDPRRERRQAREELTLAELFERYLDQYAKPKKKTWKNDDWTFNCYLGGIKSRPLSTISRSDLMTLHARIGKDTPYAANRVLALLSKMFSFAADIGFAGDNPAKRIKKFTEQSRERFLNGDELQRFFTALAEEPEPWPDYFTLLLLIGARRSNIEAMKFEEINWHNEAWTIPDTKSGKPLTLPISKQALEILKRRQANSRGSPFVFPGGSRQGHMNSPETSWKRILIRSGLTNVRMHDLRRTLGSWQAATGASLPIIGKSLGHKNQSTTSIYARLDLEPVRVAVDTAVAAMMTAANGKKEVKESNPAIIQSLVRGPQPRRFQGRRLAIAVRLAGGTGTPIARSPAGRPS